MVFRDWLNQRNSTNREIPLPKRGEVPTLFPLFASLSTGIIRGENSGSRWGGGHFFVSCFEDGLRGVAVFPELAFPDEAAEEDLDGGGERDGEQGSNKSA